MIASPSVSVRWDRTDSFSGRNVGTSTRRSQLPLDGGLGVNGGLTALASDEGIAGESFEQRALLIFRTCDQSGMVVRADSSTRTDFDVSRPLVLTESVAAERPSVGNQARRGQATSSTATAANISGFAIRVAAIESDDTDPAWIVAAGCSGRARRRSLKKTFRGVRTTSPAELSFMRSIGCAPQNLTRNSSGDNS